MRGSSVTWKPVAAKLINELVANKVIIDNYHLFTYVDTMVDIVSTKEPYQLRSGYLSENSRDVNCFEANFEFLAFSITMFTEISLHTMSRTFQL